MGKIQVDSGRSSAATHRLTQTSTTLNRRYVRRPSNLAVDAAAHAAELREKANSAPRVAPSRLVNLGVHNADLEKAQSAAISSAAMPPAENPGPKSITISTPNIVEFGCDPSEESSTSLNPESASEMNQSMDVMPESASATEQSATMLPAPAPAPAPEIDTAALAASIAADYAATSLGISMREFGNGTDYAMAAPSVETTDENVAASADAADATTGTNSDSVEAIALAASNAIASIREATDPDQVSDQVASLKAFADNIKANQSMPEMRELSDTIDKFVTIAMKSTKVQEENEKNAAAKVTLSPKVTRAAAKVTRSSAKVMAANNRTKTNSNLQARGAMRGPSNLRSPGMRRTSSQELKSRAIESALASVATMEDRAPKSRRPMIRRKTGAKRFAFAFVCAIFCVGAVICYVGANIPDISVRVAAMQTGIQASYPSYIPRDYSLGDISSEDGKITMVFNGPEDSTFKLIEEKTSWDSSALLRNYVEPSWGEAYATTHEQGITIYISEETSNAAWVNGGVLYKITSTGAALTKKQVRSIVTSM